MSFSRPQVNPIKDTGIYDASSIIVLPGLEAVRQNPAMYIGSTDLEGVHHLLYEAVYNSIDESLAGHCSRIEIVLEKDGSCSVDDDGRGIPVDLHPASGRPACEVVLTTLHAGGKFRPGSYLRTAGIHGVGISCTNALSEWLLLDVWRDGMHYQQRFARGAAVSELKKMGPSLPAEKRGTRITFLPDAAIFPGLQGFSYDVLARRLKELAFLHKGILIRLEDKRWGGKSEVFQFNSGISGFVADLNQSRTLLHKDPVCVEYHSPCLEFELVMQWTTEYHENIFSYVNSNNTVYGGTHVFGLKAALTKAINIYAQEIRLLKINEDERISTFDIFEGLTGVLSVKMDHPRFEGQTKTRLTNQDVQTLIEQIVTAEFLKILRQDSKLANRIVNRALDAARARLAARRAGERMYFQNMETRGISQEVYRKQFGIRSKNWHQSAAWITDEELLSRHVGHLGVGEDARMLDVCCGSGVVGGSFRGKVGKIEGLDLTPEMINLAKTRLDEVHKGTVYDLPFAPGTFDLVVTREVLHLLPSPEKPVAEIFRVLRPGGQFIVGQILPFGAEDGVWMYRVFKKKQPLIFNMFQEEDFRQLLLGAGFVDLKMTEYHLWESIDVWIDTHETSSLHRHEIRDLFYHAPQEARDIHPFEILPSGEIRDLWRWCIFSARKPSNLY
jgi:DNA gyrase subunit B